VCQRNLVHECIPGSLLNNVARRTGTGSLPVCGPGTGWSIRGMTEIPRFAWFATINKGAIPVRHSGESDAGQICPASTQDTIRPPLIAWMHHLLEWHCCGCDYCIFDRLMRLMLDAERAKPKLFFVDFSKPY
jgi:hypothetical protein